MNPVAHLIPGMNPMTVRTQKAEVSCVGFPVSESVVPDACTAFVSQLHGWINVIYVKNPVICFAANNALSAKAFNQFQLPFPVARVAMFLESVFVPVILAASVAAIAVFAWLSALLTRLRFSPPSGKVTGLPTILPSSILHPVGMGLKFFRAMLTDFCDLCFLAHVVSPNRRAQYNTINFDIACRRIEQAYAQPRLFEDAKVGAGDTAVQGDMLLTANAA